MSVTNELDELIALHGNARDALNVTLAKLRHAQDVIAVLKEAAQQTVAVDVANVAPCKHTFDGLYCIHCGEALF